MSNLEQRLGIYARMGIHLGLDRMLHLLDKLGNPQNTYPVIHVAGTNGKGSVCAFLSSVLHTAGYSTARYTSPHLTHWCERIWINQEWIPEADFCAALDRVEAAIDPAYFPTQFEIVTAVAWWYFAQQKVDVAVIETGLGGRLDATNVCPSPLATIITSISRDHWQRLGDSLVQIATEKAGIIKPHCPIVVPISLPPEAQSVMVARAQNLDSPLLWVKPAVPQGQEVYYQGMPYILPLEGEHQCTNLALALATLHLLQQQGWKISQHHLRMGIAKTLWPGRMQWLTYRSCAVLLDGAHNLAGANFLRQYLDQRSPNQNYCWVVGILETKDHQGIIQALIRSGDWVIAVSPKGHQGVDPQEIIDHITVSIQGTIAEGAPAAIARSVDIATQQKIPIVVAGSLYLVGECLAILTSPAPPGSNVPPLG